jgi:ribosomal protein L30E
MTEKQIKDNKSKILFGINTSLKNLDKTHYISNNCPKFIIDKLESKSLKFQILELDSERLGKILARNHNVSIICK